MNTDNILVQASLYAYPEYDREIRRWKLKLERLTGIGYCIENPIESLNNMFGKIDECMAYAENFAILKNVIFTAISRLKPKEREIVELVFFKRQSKENICQSLGIKDYTLRYIKNKSIKSIQNTMIILGMDNKRMVELFDDSSLLIRWAEYVEHKREKAKLAFGEKEVV